MNNGRSGPAVRMVSVWCFFILLSAIARPTEDKIFIKTENGIPVVYNPKNPAPPDGSPRSLVLQHELTIGEDETDPNSMFSRLRSIQVDDQENIYALDSKETKVKVFDKDGKFLRSFGKKGQGPGEVDRPIRMEMTRDNRLVLADTGNNKLAYFGLDGSLVKELLTGKNWALVRLELDSQGNIYAETMTFEATKWALQLKKFGPDFKPMGTITSFEEKRPDPRLVRAFSPAHSFHTRTDDLLVWTIARSDKYEFTVCDGTGKIMKKFIRAYDPVKIPGPIKDRLTRERWGDEGIPPDIKFEIPSHFPSLENFIIDDQDRIYVRTYAYEEKDDDRWLYHDVFDAEGRYFAKFLVPEQEMVFQSKKGKLYCLVYESQAGIPLVKRYKMIWK